MAYTKLFNSIVTSSIWGEKNSIRIVWITLMALADKNGEVQASVPGLARVACVSVAECEEAIESFLSPDKYSRTADDEGRRLEIIDGGWSLINHAKYRKMASKEDSKTKNAERQARYRAKQLRNEKVTDSNGLVTDSNADVTQDRDIAEAEAEAEADTKEEKKEEEKTAPFPKTETKDENPTNENTNPPYQTSYSEKDTFVRSKALEIYEDVFPTSMIDGHRLEMFAKKLPNVNETVWRQTLEAWRLNGYKSNNLAGLISKYEKELEHDYTEPKKDKFGFAINPKKTKDRWGFATK